MLMLVLGSGGIRAEGLALILGMVRPLDRVLQRMWSITEYLVSSKGEIIFVLTKWLYITTILSEPSGNSTLTPRMTIK